MVYSPLLRELIDSLQCLPGVGAKSAQRMALHLLERNREGGERMAKAVAEALGNIGHCERCRLYTEATLCSICESADRHASKVCVVETPADVVALEQATAFEGQYFILLGRLSPLDGIGPDQLGIDLLLQRMDSGEIKELILATSATVEGEATAHYLSSLATARGIQASRIAYGVPVGGELEYVDGGTLAHAFASRTEL